MSANETKEVDGLTDTLFHAVEKAQGYFFMSDGETFVSRDEFFERIRGRLEWGKIAVEAMEKFLRRHNELKFNPRKRRRR